MTHRLSQVCTVIVFVFQAEDGIRDLVRSRGLGDVYKRQDRHLAVLVVHRAANLRERADRVGRGAAEKTGVQILSLIHI